MKRVSVNLVAISVLTVIFGGCSRREPTVDDLFRQIGYSSPPPTEVVDQLRKRMPEIEQDLIYAYTGSPPGNSREAIAIVLGELGTAKTDKFLLEQKNSLSLEILKHRDPAKVSPKILEGLKNVKM